MTRLRSVPWQLQHVASDLAWDVLVEYVVSIFVQLPLPLRPRCS